MTIPSSHAARAYWIHAMTPLHVGAGRGVGFIDLPIMREKVTNWPYVPGSSFKGVLTDKRDAAPDQRIGDSPDAMNKRLAFGATDLDKDQPGHAGASVAGSLTFSDARLVCLPVRSLYGTFSWVTCSLALRRLKRDLELIGHPDLPEVPDDLRQSAKPDLLIRTTPGSILAEPNSDEGKVYFEDLDLTRAGIDAGSPLVEQWAKQIASQVFPGTSNGWADEFNSRFSVVSDHLFDYLTETATEVAARIRIEDDTKTVADGQLWYEESLPAEAILSGFVWCDRVFANGKEANIPTQQALLDMHCPAETEETLQIGGKASVGRGRVRCLFR